MSAVEVLSTPPANPFPAEWYDYALEDHFWMSWRLRAFLAQARWLELPLRSPWRGLDIGCGYGILRAQLERSTCWTLDGIDLSLAALERNPALRGRTMLYDIHDRRPELRHGYDFLILFDVLEHVEEPGPFLESALFHLKPGGLLLVNVPALRFFYGPYDRAAGHHRRYDRASLRAELLGAGLEIADMRYWGLSLLPLLLARNALLRSLPAEQTLAAGFRPPSPLVNRMLRGLMRLETALLSKPPAGASLLAAVRKPDPARDG